MKEQMNRIADFMLKHINADDFELYINNTESQDTRFAQNSITQHITGQFMEVTYRCIKNQRSGNASTTQLDEDNLLGIIKKAEEIAENNSPDPEYSPSLGKHDLKDSQTYFPSMEKLTTEKMIDIIKQCIDFAEKKDAKLSGILSKHNSHSMLITKNGFRGYANLSTVSISMTMSREHIETNVAYEHRDYDKLDINKILTQLGDQFDALTNIKSMDFEPIAVILRPQAVAQLMMHTLWWGFDRKMADQGMSPFSNQIGQKCMGEKLTMRSSIDDPDLPTKLYSSNNIFENIDWIKNGVLMNLRTAKDWAKKNNLKPCIPYNIIIDGEGLSEQEMMKKVKRGLIVNNLWYIRLNDMKTADATGMTRDGVLYFEDGEIKYAVNNFRFNEQFVEMTKKILATGVSTQISTSAKVPAILIDNFTFVDKTSF